jgi:hypothetical protein
LFTFLKVPFGSIVAIYGLCLGIGESNAAVSESALVALDGE